MVLVVAVLVVAILVVITTVKITAVSTTIYSSFADVDMTDSKSDVLIISLSDLSSSILYIIRSIFVNFCI